MIIEIIETFLVLWFLHALADFTFQTEIMAKLKNRNTDKKRKDLWIYEQNEVIPAMRTLHIPDGQKYQLTWYYWLSAHALIQGGLIYIIFGNLWIFIMEIIAHFTMDFIKCSGKTNIHQDQVMHISLRVLYTSILVI